ncbi:hypothetical protein LJC55_04055 [Eubacteriales bacterium OttesenSCG-928-N14]|nr:hypothetical protein [Eubacteriales bacterium OttesenSCG-928-N14]
MKRKLLLLALAVAMVLTATACEEEAAATVYKKLVVFHAVEYRRGDSYISTEELDQIAQLAPIVESKQPVDKPEDLRSPDYLLHFTDSANTLTMWWLWVDEDAVHVMDSKQQQYYVSDIDPALVKERFDYLYVMSYRGWISFYLQQNGQKADSAASVPQEALELAEVLDMVEHYTEAETQTLKKEDAKYILDIGPSTSLISWYVHLDSAAGTLFIQDADGKVYVPDHMTPARLAQILTESEVFE